MRNQFTKCTLFIVFLFLTQVIQAQVSGSVFRDFNANGIKTTAAPDPIELGLAGVTVNAYDVSGALFTVTTTANGDYAITGGVGPYRIEFILPPYYYASNGTVSSSTVQFVAAGGTANLGVNYPADFCQANPSLAIPNFDTGSGVNSTKMGLGSFKYNDSGQQTKYGGSTPNMNSDATFAQVGSTWGVSYQREQKRLFASSFLKRHSGLAKGSGFVYVMDYSTGTGSLAHSFDLQGVVTASGGTIDLGTINRTNITGSIANGAAGDYQLSDGRAVPTVDLDAFAKSAKMSFGDNDLSEDGKTLWLVNLFQRSLISVDVSSGATTSLPGTVNQYLLSDITGYPTPVNGTIRPWGLKFYKGRGYLGLVNDASTGSSADLKAYVVSFDPTNVAAGFTTELSFPLNFSRDASNNWRPWIDTWVQGTTPNTDFKIYPQDGTEGFVYPSPILSDIEFQPNGEMLLGFRDRFGDQMGGASYKPISSDRNVTYMYSRGDLLKACNNGGTYTIESGTGCATNPIAGANGPFGTGEFFADIIGDGAKEGLSGGLALLPGTNEIVSTALDPKPTAVNVYTAAYASSQGIHFNNLSTGVQTDWFQIEPKKLADGTSNSKWGKANGLGDIELLCNPAPIEIGNRVFMDTDKDGEQDADEMGLDGITVELWKAGAKVTDYPTANGGQWFFTNLDANTAYEVKILSASIPSGKDLTIFNTLSNAKDLIDNDATLVGSDAVITYTTGSAGQNNHTLDFGFKAACIKPSTISFTATEGNCTGTTPNNDAKIDFIGITNADKADKSEGATYTGVDYSSATGTISLGDISFTGLKHATAYTFRFWNAADACYKDTTITTPTKTCVIPCNLSAGATGTNAKCNLGTDGTATVTAAGNVGAVTYLWSNLATTAAITGLAAGTYTVTVTETASCTATTSYVVTEPTALVLMCTKSDVTTIGGSDGTASVTASGGTATYTYLWSNGATTTTISGLAAGTYMVTVTDANLCSKVCESIVNAPGCNLTASANGTNAKCNLGTDGTATVTAAGNVGAVTYLWSNLATTAAITGLAAGTYTVTVTETASCTATASYTVTEPTALALMCTKSDATTVGGSEGTATVAASGGTAGYTYLWSNGATAATISGLVAGTYMVTVTDANLCSKTCSSIVTQPMAATCNLIDGGVTVSIDEKGTTSTADDEYVVYANPTGTGLSATYNVTGTITKTGVLYNVITEIGRVSTANAEISYFIEDSADANCSLADAAFNLNANTCILKANPTVLCNDNGTPSDPNDDTFSVSLNPTGNGIGTTYNVTGGITASNIAYGSAQQIATGLLISAGAVTITVKDATTANCELINIRIDPPAACSGNGVAKLDLDKSVDVAQAKVGDDVTYTIIVRNTGTAPSNAIEVLDTLNSNLQFVLATPAAAYNNATGLWTVGVLPVGGSATLTIVAKLLGIGVTQNYADITVGGNNDSDGPLNNTDVVCTTVPVELCTGQTFTATIPSTYTQIQWYKDGVLIAGATASSLLINAIGDYTFTSKEATSGCSADGCCPIRVIAGTNCCPAKICMPVKVKRN